MQILFTFILTLRLLLAPSAADPAVSGPAPETVGEVARKLVGSLRASKERNPMGIESCWILQKGKGVGVRIRLEKKGQIELQFDIAGEKKDGFDSVLKEGIVSRRTLFFRSVKEPGFQWSLGSLAIEKLELELSKPENRMLAYRQHNSAIFDESSGQVLQSLSRVHVVVENVEQAVLMIEAYYSSHPKNVAIWME